MESLSAILGNFNPLPSDTVKKRVQAQLDKMARFSPILRFILVDPKERSFKAERWSYFSDIDDWIGIGEPGRLDRLVRRLIPKLGTDDFY